VDIDTGKIVLDYVNDGHQVGTDSKVQDNGKAKGEPQLNLRKGKGKRTYEFTHTRRGLINNCQCMTKLEDVTYSLVEFPYPQCCTNDVHLAGFSGSRLGSLRHYTDFRGVKTAKGKKALNLTGHQVKQAPLTHTAMASRVIP
jgi:hypothetical protein